MSRKGLPNGLLPTWLWGSGLSPPSVVRPWGDAQGLAKLLHGHLGLALNDILVSAHRVGWPKMTKAFFKIANSCSARLGRARRARTSGSLPNSAASCACCQRWSSLGLMPSCQAAACVLRLSDAKRSVSALNASSYLRRLSGVVLLFGAVMTQEIYFLLLCALPRPPHSLPLVSCLASLRAYQGAADALNRFSATFPEQRLQTDARR